MKKIVAIAGLLVIAMLGGCASGPNQTVGTGVGAIGGYAVGRALGGGAAGSAVGAVAGALVGSSVGQSMDQQQHPVVQQYPPVVYRDRMVPVVTCFYVREWDRYYRVYVDHKVCR
jgi:osmotically inducible lipoprotein OsmB